MHKERNELEEGVAEEGRRGEERTTEEGRGEEGRGERGGEQWRRGVAQPVLFRTRAYTLSVCQNTGQLL